MDNPELADGSVWRHNKTGQLFRVVSVALFTYDVRLITPAGREISVSPGQLANLYTQSEAVADFVEFEPAPATISIGRLTMDTADELPAGVAPLADRRTAWRGSLRNGGDYHYAK